MRKKLINLPLDGIKRFQSLEKDLLNGETDLQGDGKKTLNASLFFS